MDSNKEDNSDGSSPSDSLGDDDDDEGILWVSEWVRKW